MKRKSIRNVFVAAFCMSSMGAATQALAIETIDVAANVVRVQDYNTGVTIWFTGSPCTYGQMTLDPTDTMDRHKQLLASVLAAKAMGARLHLEYDVGGGQCVIRNFAVDGP